jgi:spore coat protein CotH
VTKIKLHLPAASRAALKEDPGEYVPARFRLERGNGRTYGPLRIGVRLKGFSSFRPLAGKSAFKIKFDEFVEDQAFQGLEALTLNNMVQDPTMLRELLAYKAFRAVGLPAWRTGYSFLRIDGEAYGVYLNVESPDEVSAARLFPTTSHLYEAEAVDLTPGAAPGVDAVADLEQMTRFWAVEKYIGHWDSYSGRPYPNNYYLHSDAAGRFTMLPWGTDQTWVTPAGYGNPGGVLFNRCLADAGCAALYRAAVEDVRATLGSTDLRGLAKRTAKRLAPWRAKDPKQEWSERQVRKWTKRLHRFLADRPDDTTWLTPADAP